MRGQDGLDGHRHLDRAEIPRQAIGSTLAGQPVRLHQGPHALLEKERVAFRSLDQEPLQRPEPRFGSQESAQQALGARLRQRIDSQLRVVALVPPRVLILGAVTRQEEDPGRGQSLDESVEQGLGLGIHPVEIVKE